MEFLKGIQIKDVAKIELPINGLASLDYLKNKLDEFLGGKTFSDLKYPLYLAVSNLFTGKVEYICEGDVAQVVQASASIPILFSPVEIGGQLYVDGGLMDNVPVNPLIGNCDILIAVDIMPVENMEGIEGLKEIIIRVFQMSVSMQKDSKESCDLLIKLDGLSDYTILDTDQNEKIFKVGYNYVKNMDISKIMNSI